MADSPLTLAVPQIITTANNQYGPNIGRRAINAGSGGFTTVAWGTANLSIAVPMRIPHRYPVKSLCAYNFATVNGNVDVGIYNRDFALIASVGGTAQSGATGFQYFAKDVVLEPDFYYFALASSSTTATFACMQTGTTNRFRYSGLVQMATAYPLPATYVPATIATLRIPLIGVCSIASPVF